MIATLYVSLLFSLPPLEAAVASQIGATVVSRGGLPAFYEIPAAGGGAIASDGLSPPVRRSRFTRKQRAWDTVVPLEDVADIRFVRSQSGRTSEQAPATDVQKAEAPTLEAPATAEEQAVEAPATDAPSAQALPEAEGLAVKTATAEALASVLEQKATLPDGQDSYSDMRARLTCLVIGAVAAAWATRVHLDRSHARSDVPSVDGQAMRAHEAPVVINTMLELLWPRISTVVTGVIVEEVEPAIRAALPASLQGIHFERESCHLGHQPPCFEAMSATRRTQCDGGESVALTGTLRWEGDACICLKLSGAGFGISGLSIRGIIVFELVGLMDKAPLFEGIRMYFVNSPELSLEFDGVAAFLNIGVLKSTIVETVSAQISRRLVLPHAIGFGVSPQADAISMSCPPAEGVLWVFVRGAEELLAVDSHLTSASTSDPYVVVSCGEQEGRSPTAWGTRSPSFLKEDGGSWGVPLEITSVGHQRVRMRIMDASVVTSERFLGSLDLSVEDMVAWNSSEQILDLRDAKGQVGTCGRAFIRAAWLPVSDEPEAAGEADQLYARVYGASGLPVLEEGTEYWVSVSCNGLAFASGSWSTGHQVYTPDKTEHLSAANERLQVARKYGMSDKDITKLLGGVGANASGACFDLDFGESHPFYVKKVSTPTVRFEVHAKRPSAAKAEILGSVEISAADLVAENSWLRIQTIMLPGTAVFLKIRLQRRFLAGSFSWLPPGVAGASDSEGCAAGAASRAPATLHVTFIGATGLKRLNVVDDAPYCVCEVQRAKHGLFAADPPSCSTRSIRDELAPDWGETHELAPWHGEALRFVVHHQGMIGSKRGGMAELSGARLCAPGVFDGELSLDHPPGAKLRVHVRADVRPTEPSAAAAAALAESGRRSERF